jgi:HK97 gp10 family phage protein
LTQINVVVEGLDELLTDFQHKFPAEYKRVVSRAMNVVVKDVERWAKRNAPVDTGRLRSSIGGEVKTLAGEVVGIVGTNVKYAPFVEEGGRKPRGVGRIPFLRPAVEEHEGEILETFKKAVETLTKAMEG